MFDTITDFGWQYANILPEEIIEAMDTFANYCGDIAKGREYEPELPDIASFSAIRSEGGNFVGIKFPSRRGRVWILKVEYKALKGLESNGN
jgi:hypothetical protein